MGQLMGQLGWLGMTHVMFFVFISQFLALYYWIIFLYLHITKASPCLTPYRLKDKKGAVALSRLIALKIMISIYDFKC
jgi:hypothetical protein